MNATTDEFFKSAKRWQPEIDYLRRIVLDCGLNEVLRWKQPCYTYKKKNILIIGTFKEYCALLFFKGALLKDTHDILLKPGEHTQAGRQIRFTNVEDIPSMEATLKAYIFEAIEVEKSGLKVPLKELAEYRIPEELQDKFDNNIALKKAFEALTPGRQKGYVLYFSAPKQSKTSVARIEKYIPRILDGKGFHDCVCGHSKKMPTCDGSHKYIK